ncbi:MAG: T9SS type A sorting domain-containing protein [Bacteroidetes bacterium]|nr:T9SS type A sorting domain-containing protein [Bacteroidota bacterium]
MKRLLTLLATLVCCSTMLKATDVTGILTSNTTWNLAGSPYTVTGNVTVNPGVTLTIDSAVIVKFNNSRNMSVNGKLIAKYASFTSSATSPTSGIWDNIQFGTSTYFGQGTLKNCNFNYANQIYVQKGSVSFDGCTLDNFYSFGIQCSDSLSIKDTYINMPAYYSGSGFGIYALANANITANNLDIGNCRYGYYVATNAKVTTSNGCSIIGADQYGVYAEGQLNMAYTDVDLSGYTSPGYGIGTASGAQVSLDHVNITHSNIALDIYPGTNILITNCNFTNNIWPGYYEGTGSVATSGTNNFTGNTRNAFYVPISTLTTSWTLPTINVPYYFVYGLNISSTGILTILSGNILKVGRYYGITVDGVINANSNPGTFIYFTSERDDNWGGDTNNDGATTSPVPQDWYGITFNNISIDASCLLRRCKVRYAGLSNSGAINLISASPTIDYCDLSNSYYGVMMQAASNPVFTNNTIGSSQMTPIAISYEANPILATNTLSFSDNAYDAIGLLGGTMTANAVLPVRNFSGVQNITYLMLDNITIPQGLTLTINKGVVIKTYYPTSSYSTFRKFIVEGKLTAVGTPDSLIVFTSARDDNFGNPHDTNKDGSQTSPAIGDWGGFLFKVTSDTASKLNYCRIYYGDNDDYRLYNNQYTYEGGQITLVNASPSIQNCIIKHDQFGVYCAGNSHPKLFNNSFDHSTVVPVARSISAAPILSGNTIVNASNLAIGIIGEDLGVSGTITRLNFAGYTNISYLLLSNLFISAGAYVSIDSGVVIKVNACARIEVNGGLKVLGGILASNKVVFTSIKDDNEGNPGDTNNDGSTTSPGGGDWDRIQFNDLSDDLFCHLNNLKIKYGGCYSQGSLSFVSANTQVDHSTISYSSNYGIWSDGASIPIIDNLTIQNCTNDPIAMSLKSDPQFTNITFSNNGSNGIRIIEGTLSSNARLRKRNIAGISNIAYIIQQLVVSENALLTIEPGVVIKFPLGNSNLLINGQLSAIGTAQEPIVFTSFMDDSKGGDTNNDGNNTTPNRGDWGFIDFSSLGVSQQNKLSNCTVSYGGFYNPCSYYEQRLYKHFAEVCINNTIVTIDSSVFKHSSTSGIGIYGNASPTISNSTFSNLSATPIIMSLFSKPVFGNNNHVSNVGLFGLGIAIENYSSSDTVIKRNFAGIQNITYILFSYYQYWCGSNNSSINSGTIITIPKGIVFKYSDFNGNSWQTPNGKYLDVNGGIKIFGTVDEPVVFTDFRDDSYGNPLDTNGDGSLTAPSINSQYILNFSSISDDANCTINHAIFKYQDNAILIQQASPTIKNSTFEKNNIGINMNGVSEPIIDSCKFNNLTYTPFEFSLVSYPSSTIGNIISGTTYKALGVKAETMAQNVVIPKRNFGGVTNIPYYFNSSFTVGTGSIMTIKPGVTLKFNASSNMTIRNGLMAEGGSSPDSTIVFTDIRDDFYGGDSNSDGSLTQPGYGPNPITGGYQYPWTGIVFEDESDDIHCKLNHCIIRYSGYNYGDYAGVRCINASPSITNTVLNKNNVGVQSNGASNPIVNNCDIYGNVAYGVQNAGLAFNINAENCWWGSNTGPSHSGNPGGTGDAVTNMVDYSPWRTSGASVPLMGDVSLNGIVQAYDASLVLQNVVGSITLNSTQQQVADVSGAAGITAYDASLILQYVVGLIQYFPAELLKAGALMLTDPQLVIGSVLTTNGQDVTIPIRVINGYGMFSTDIMLKYDPAYLQFSQVINQLNGMNMTFSNDSINNILTIALAGINALTTDTTALMVTFHAFLPSGYIGTTELTVGKFLANESDLTATSLPGVITISDQTTGIRENNLRMKGKMFHVFPNPSSGDVSLSYQLDEDNLDITIEVYNMMGQKIETINTESTLKGNHLIQFANSGSALQSGTYILRLTVNGCYQTQMFQIVR